MFLSKLFITILQSCLRILFSTALSQFSAYIDRDPEEEDDGHEAPDDKTVLTVKEVHERSEDAVSSGRHLRLGDGLALTASSHLLQQPPHLLHGAVDLGADTGKYFDI